jgi:hypothetical protein
MEEQFLMQTLEQFSVETSEPKTPVEQLTLLEIWLISKLFDKEFENGEVLDLDDASSEIFPDIF